MENREGMSEKKSGPSIAYSARYGRCRENMVFTTPQRLEQVEEKVMKIHRTHFFGSFWPSEGRYIAMENVVPHLSHPLVPQSPRLTTILRVGLEMRYMDGKNSACEKAVDWDQHFFYR